MNAPLPNPYAWWARQPRSDTPHVHVLFLDGRPVGRIERLPVSARNPITWTCYHGVGDEAVIIGYEGDRQDACIRVARATLPSELQPPLPPLRTT